MPRRIYVLDTSAVIAGFTPGLADVEQVTVQKVLEEAKDLCSRLELETAVVAGKMKVMEPSKSSLAEVHLRVGQTGDRVSDTDVELLALALDLRWAGEEPMLVTDDYAIQNLARLLGIPYRRVAMPGITEVLTWEMVCPACGTAYPATASQCEVCGSSLIRRPRR
ncbi:MAG: ribonuclease VapC [Hadesarchaea archaeon]|nr:ribonuclease VapC [Hadesarchaea archaeon]